MTTPKRNEAVAPCAWIVSNGGECCEPWLVYERREAEAMPSACIVVPVYSQQSISALQGEVSRLREFVDAVKACRGAESEVRYHEAVNPKSRNYRLPVYEAQRIAHERVTELLTNLEPPTDGR